MSMTFVIYKITNLLNGKIYIGKTNDVQKRWYNHVYCALVENEQTYFYNAIRKYGALNFKIEVIEEYDSDAVALGREVQLIKELNSNNKNIGYNITAGGEGVSGLKHTDETKHKISLSHAGRKLTNEHKEKIRKGNLGKKVSEKFKKKLSVKRMNDGNPMFNKTISDKTRDKLSNFQKHRIRNPLSKEHKDKIKKAVMLQDRKFRILPEIKEEIILLYNDKIYNKRQLSEKFNLKYNTVVKILRKK